jgi:hypothetical protein
VIHAGTSSPQISQFARPGVHAAIGKERKEPQRYFPLRRLCSFHRNPECTQQGKWLIAGEYALLWSMSHLADGRLTGHLDLPEEVIDAGQSLAGEHFRRLSARFWLGGIGGFDSIRPSEYLQTAPQ